MLPIDDLLDTIFDGRQPALYFEFERWVRDSRRYRAFAEAYRDKIRSKLRNVSDEAGLNDVRAELETAASLLRDKRFTLAYETYAAAKQRGPDFTVTFRTHTPFTVEVRRIRGGEWKKDTDAAASRRKLTAVLVDKVGQMPPSTINLLWLTAEFALAEADLIGAMTALRQSAERKQEDYFTDRGFAGAADFLKQYQQLSGIVLNQAGEVTVWLNPLARHRTPPEIVSAIQRLGIK